MKENYFKEDIANIILKGIYRICLMDVNNRQTLSAK